MDASVDVRLRTYLFWSFWAGVAFFAVYPAMNWITSLRRAPFHLYLTRELAIPFVPLFIWPYLSMYLLFALPLFFVPAERMAALGKQLIAGCLISAAMFLLIPAELGFRRQVPDSYAAIYAGMFNIDRPYNLVPSLHVIWSAAIVLACADFARTPVRIALLAWLGVVIASTILVHQHHLLDVIAALAIVFFLRRQYEVQHA
jgi:membrane-associated phospholipid phosphatase